MNLFSLIQKKGLISTLYKIKRMIFVRDEGVISTISRLGAYDYLKRYKNHGQIKPEFNSGANYENPYPNKIWTVWLQGLENAPNIVQKCVRSIQNQHGKDVLVLDNTNISLYVEIPKYLAEKWKKGIISNTHYTDVVRILLLAKYGGVWVDATIFLFAPIPSFIRGAELFCFKSSHESVSLASVWLIAAKPGNSIILKLQNLLLAYWKKENKLVSYSIISLFHTMIVTQSESEKAAWKSVPHFEASLGLRLQMELFDKYNSERLEQIKQMSVIQKLSYKFSDEDFDKKGTFYSEIINQTQI
jgi:mannosyltransferase OCH1-like enzyme